MAITLNFDSFIIILNKSKQDRVCHVFKPIFFSFFFLFSFLFFSFFLSFFPSSSSSFFFFFVYIVSGIFIMIELSRWDHCLEGLLEIWAWGMF
jgi:hypothetical protein